MKSKAFERLRLGIAHGAAGACLVLSGGVVSRAGAGEVRAKGHTATVTRTGIEWYVGDTSTNGITGMGLTDASFAGPVVTTGGVTNTLTDAFDGCEVMAVDGTSYADPDGTLDLVGNDMIGSPMVISGLNVSRVFHWNGTALANGTAVMRSLNTFSNPGAMPITVTVSFGCNLGSDSSSGVEGSSSGDAIVTNADRWFITSDAQPYDDPPVTHVRYGIGAAVTATFDPMASLPGPGVGDFTDQYSVTIPAGSTRHILRYIGLSNGAGTSLADAPSFDSGASLQAAGLLAGIAPGEFGNIVNFAFSPAEPAVIPSTNGYGLIWLTGLIGLAGLLGWRSRYGA